jgi:hypothetical protein
MFYDIERYFGSQGNFFDLTLQQGIYWCNPPYDNTIMEKMAEKVLSYISNNIALVITIPIWDDKTKDNIKKYDYKNIIRNLNKDHNYKLFQDYKTYSLLKPYIKDELIIPKQRIPYFNYSENTHIYAVNTYMLVVYDKIETRYVNNLKKLFDVILDIDKTNYFTKYKYRIKK